MASATGAAEPTLDAGALAALVDALTRAALDEHASVAAFARTICQLLSLGAPAWLVTKTHAALADEIRHAEATFAWIERLGGPALAPASLPSATAPFAGAESVEALAHELLRDVFRGGCVGETLAAHDAAERARTAPIEELRSFHGSVAEDEARHAALAYETASWLVTAFPSARAALDDELARFEREAPRADAALLAPLLAVLG